MRAGGGSGIGVGGRLVVLVLVMVLDLVAKLELVATIGVMDQYPPSYNGAWSQILHD